MDPLPDHETVIATRVRTLPQFEIHWYWLLRAKRHAKAEEHVRRFAKKTGVGVIGVESRMSATRKGLLEVRFITPLAFSDIQPAVFAALCYCRDSRLQWTYNGPFEYRGGRWEFSGTSLNVAEGYEWISFTLQNWVWEDVDEPGATEVPATYNNNEC